MCLRLPKQGGSDKSVSFSSHSCIPFWHTPLPLHLPSCFSQALQLSTHLIGCSLFMPTPFTLPLHIYRVSCSFSPHNRLCEDVVFDHFNHSIICSSTFNRHTWQIFTYSFIAFTIHSYHLYTYTSQIAHVNHLNPRSLTFIPFTCLICTCHNLYQCYAQWFFISVHQSTIHHTCQKSQHFPPL